jgi:hypothetical protein
MTTTTTKPDDSAPGGCSYVVRLEQNERRVKR